MIVYFLRHAEAEDRDGNDHVRRLTARGLEQAAKVGKFLGRVGIRPDLILTSPVVRARQTAEIVAKATGVDLVEERWLACGMEPAACIRELGAYSTKESVMLVGHEPDFSVVIAALIGHRDADVVKVRKASLTAVELGGGCGQLQFLVPARLM